MAVSGVQSHARASRLNWGYGLGAVVVLGVVGVVILGMGMRKIINHDEHQFVAAGALIARAGLVPYLDFPYFHVPGLAYLYALIFTLTDRLLLAARGVAVLASWGMLALLFFAPVRLWGAKAGWQTGLGGALVVLLLIATQTFRYTTGWAWNHDVPVLLMVGACWLHIRHFAGQFSRQTNPRWGLAIGLLMGLAVAMRASFALPALVFGFFLLPVAGFTVRPLTAWRPLLWFGLGGVIGLIPAWFFLLRAPAEFLFGNFEYVRLNTEHYLEVGGLAPGEGWRQKWEMTRDTMVLVWRANFALVLLTVVQLVRGYAAVRHAPDLRFLLTLIPVALISGYAPTPMQIQYIYLVFPLLALLNLALLARDTWPRLGLALLLAASVYGATQAAQDFRESWIAAWQPATWVPNQVHRQGQEIGRLTAGAPVITLAPIYPLEGGAEILPELVSGPFGWRVANLVEPSVRQTMGIVGPEEMAHWMAEQPPRAMLVGIHGAHAALEPVLNEFAQAHGYVPVTVAGFAPTPGTLWLMPELAR